jgi:dephospho-CoA kinase
VLLIGLTGGIGSGKSTVSALLAAKGAVIIDADAITRELQQPGTEVFTAMVERFGRGIVAADGTLDRAAVADVVFNDADALKDLNLIVHPAVGAEIAQRLQAEVETDHLVVLDVPLLVESGRDDMAALVVVDVDPEIAVRRLVDQRGMREEDARARMASQVPRDERLAKADLVIDNSGTPADLAAQIDELWPRLLALGASA